MGGLVSRFFPSAIDFKKDFDDVIMEVNIDKEKLTKENFIDEIFAAIWDNK